MSLSPFLHPFAPPAMPAEAFINIVRGDGAMVYDDAGNGYIDGMASLWYANVGHGRAQVAEAAAAEMRKVIYHTFPPYTNTPAEDLAARIAGLFPVADSRVFFTSSGSEAIDTVLKIARIAQKKAGHAERTMLVSRGRAYHGTAYGGTSMQGIPPNQELFDPLVPDTMQIDPDDVDALEDVFATYGGRIAGFITEPVQGAGGVYPPRPGYLERVRQLCTEHGAYFILDEVICAWGRLGTWFASEYYDVTPDLITFAKGVTSGYVPLGGVIVTPGVREPLEADPGWVLRTGFTYSAHAAACAAALACLDITEREGLLERSVRAGERLGSGFQSLAAEDLVAEARGEVDIWAVKLHDDKDCFAVRDAMLAEGVIARPLGGNALAYCPPLVTTDAQIDTMVEVLAGAVS